MDRRFSEGRPRGLSFMPVLPAEPDVFPSDLFECERTDGRVWRVAHTKPRQEKALSRELSTRGIPFYLPCLPKRSMVRGRVVTAMIPLFASYAFVRGDQADRLATLTTHRVTNFLEVPDQDRLWNDLSQVKRLLDAGLPVTPESAIGPGERVEITTGPFAGLRGQVIRTATGGKLIVSVNFIRQGVSIVLDDWMLVRCSE